MRTRSRQMKVTDAASWHVARIDLWWSSVLWQPDWASNTGFQQARRLLAQAAGNVSPGLIGLHGVADLPEDQARRLYAEQVQQTASGYLREGSWNYRVARVFGSHCYPGCWTAREVPLLLIRFAEFPAHLAAPHQTRKATETQPQLRTILDVLRILNPEEQRRIFGELPSDSKSAVTERP